jgi:hypothetical protein
MLFKVNFSLTASGGLPCVTVRGSGIALGSLTADREVPGVAGASIGLQGLKPVYVLARKLSQLTFDAVPFLHGGLYTI